MSIYRALSERLRRVGLPFYLRDCLPPGSPLPYILMEIAPPLSPHEEGTLTLTLWVAGEEPNGQRLAQMDMLLDQFPGKGVNVTTDVGALLVHPKAPVQALREDAAWGMKAAFTLQFFPNA